MDEFQTKLLELLERLCVASETSLELSQQAAAEQAAFMAQQAEVGQRVIEHSDRQAAILEERRDAARAAEHGKPLAFKPS